MKESNWINDLKGHTILLFIWVFSPHSLQFQVMNQGIITSLKFLDYKLIAVSVFEELTSKVLYNVRTLANPSNPYFSETSALLVHSESLRASFLFSMRFSTPKTTPSTPTPKTSYTSLNSFHSSMILKALLSKSTVNKVFLYPLALNQLSMLWSLRCVLTCHSRKSSMILF